MKRYELTLDPNSVPDWGVQEGLRELVQNWADNKEDSSFEYSEGWLTLRNGNTVLPPSVLMTGYSGKRDDDTQRGKHGDGMKSALAILCRENIETFITNGQVTWKPSITFSDLYQTDIVCIDEEELPIDTNAFTVMVRIAEYEYEELINRFLNFQDDIGEVFETEQGKILLDSKYSGAVFCGGLFVANDPQLKYGYDFKPALLKLDRDRNMARTFDLQWITKDMLAQLSHEGNDEQVEAMVDMVTSNSADTQYMGYENPSARLQDACHKKFEEKYGDSILADSAEDVQKLKRSGFRKVIFLGNEQFTKMVKKSSKYREINTHVKMKTPMDYMNEFKDKYETEMSDEMYDSFNNMFDNVVDSL